MIVSIQSEPKQLSFVGPEGEVLGFVDACMVGDRLHLRIVTCYSDSAEAYLPVQLTVGEEYIDESNG